MRRAARFLVVLVFGLALLSAAGYYVLRQTTRTWFESDLSLRSQLAIASASQSFANNWSQGRAKLEETLAHITRDERIMGAAACTLEGELLAATDGYPAAFSCRSMIDRMRAESAADATTWSMTSELPSGRIHLCEAEELAIAQPCQYPAFSQQYPTLCLRLIFGLIWPGRDNGRVIMRGHICVGPVDRGVVKARLGDPRLQVVGHDLRRYTPEEAKGAHMTCDPIRQGLRPGRLDKCIVRCP